MRYSLAIMYLEEFIKVIPDDAPDGMLRLRKALHLAVSTMQKRRKKEGDRGNDE